MIMHPMDDISSKIEQYAIPLIEEAGMVLFDFQIRRHGREVTIELFIDRPNGGITIDECTGIHRRLRDILTLENLLTDDYTLEVSSPGTDRPLKTKKDFVRVMNYPVRFFLAEPVAERIEYDGVVKKVDEENVVINFKEQDVVIPILKINKATVLI